MTLEESNRPLKVRTKLRQSRTYRIIIAFNLLAGLMLWFGYLTDYSWAGTVADSWYPALAAIVAAFSLMLEDKGPSDPTRNFYKWVCVPSLIGGLVKFVLGCFLAAGRMLLFPLSLGAGSITDERLVQTVPSPDGSRTAYIHLKPYGGYAGGLGGSVYVKVRYRWLPFVEREILHVPRSYAGEDAPDFLRWKDDDTFVVFGDPASQKPYDVEIGVVRFKLPRVSVW